MADYQQFTVIRHGESQTNATNTFQAGNQYDLDPLTRLVLEDATPRGTPFSALPVNLIISSSHLRAQHRGRDRPGDRGPIVPVWEGSSWVDLPADDPDLAIHPSLLREIDLPSELQGLAFHVLRRGRSSMPPWRWPTSLTAVSPTRRTFTTMAAACRGDPPISRGPAGAADCSGRPRRQTPTPAVRPSLLVGPSAHSTSCRASIVRTRDWPDRDWPTGACCPRPKSQESTAGTDPTPTSPLP